MTPLLPDDTIKTPSPYPLAGRTKPDWPGGSAFRLGARSTEEKKQSDLGPVNKLSIFVFIVFICGALIPLLIFMIQNYRHMVRDQIDQKESYLINASFSMKTDLEKFIAKQFVYLDHIANNLSLSINEMADIDNPLFQHIQHDVEVVGFESLIIVSPGRKILYSWPDEGILNTNLLSGPSATMEWARVTDQCLNSGERLCSAPVPEDRTQKDTLFYISVPIMTADGKIIGAGTGGVRKTHVLELIEKGAQDTETEYSLLCNDYQIPLSPSYNESEIRGHMESAQGFQTAIENWRPQIKPYIDSKGNRYAGVRTRLDNQMFKGGEWYLLIETALEPMYEHRTHYLTSAMWFLSFSLILVLVFSYALSHGTTRAIRQYLIWARSTVDGKILELDRPQGKHEIAELGKALSDMSIRLKELVRFCTSLSVGDLSRPYPVQGDNDTFGQTVNGIRDYFKSILEKIQHLVDGHYLTNTQTESAGDELSQKMLTLSGVLNKMNEDNLRQITAASAQMELIRQMSGDQNLSSMIGKLLSFLCQHLNAQIGVFYVYHQESATFVRQGTYGALDDDFPKRITPGKRLCGQAILEKKALIAAPDPQDIPDIASGLNREYPVSLMAYPFVLRHEVIAVMELGSLKDFNAEHMDFLVKNNESIAIGIHSAQTRHYTETLLEKTIKQSESLKIQREKLSKANKELAAQAKALKKSETRLMAREVELEEANTALEAHFKRLEEQARDLDMKNKELKETQSILETKADELMRSNQYKSEFLANMSHELRTPLNSIILLSKLLSDKSEQNRENKSVKFASIINASGKELLNLIDEVLDLTRLTSGSMGVNLVSYDIFETQRVLKYWFSKKAQEKNISFDVIVDNNLPETIITDPPKLEKILKNLISNAIKYTSEGSVTVEIQRPHPQTPLPVCGLDHAHTVEFSISDTGEGIPESMQSLVFEAFKQVDGSITRRHGGAGLGLSLAQGLARLLQGEIQLMHSDNTGSSFSLFLPETGPNIVLTPPSDSTPEKTVTGNQTL